MSKRASLKHQVNQALREQQRFGQSRHEAKELNNNSTPGIYSHKTMDVYREHCQRFAQWAKQEHGVRYLEDAKTLVADYFRQGKDRYSASTLKLQMAAIRKMYQDPSLGRSVSLPDRSRGDYTRSREVTPSDKHFSYSRNKDLVDICRGLGPRRHELEKIIGEDVVKDQQGNVWAHVVGKGGRERWTQCNDSLKDRVWGLATSVEPGQLILEHIHTTADIHGFRHEYAKECYRQSNGGQDYVPYHPNHEAIQKVSENLGHSREDVVYNYIT